MLKVFRNEEFGEVRTIVKDGEPWFVGKDIAEILGYSNTSDALNRHVDEEDKDALKWGSRGGEQIFTIINESGLYSLILRSKLPTAKKFKRWVTSEVLPSIRKHGVYAMDELLQNPDILINALQELKRERELNAMQKQEILTLKPKADYTDKILKCTGLVTITQIAKDYGMSCRSLNKILHDLHVQYKQSEQWLLYSEYQDKGFVHSETYDYTRDDGTTGVRMCTKWTQKGRLFLYNLLKQHNVLPTMEMNNYEMG